MAEQLKAVNRRLFTYPEQSFYLMQGEPHFGERSSFLLISQMDSHGNKLFSKNQSVRKHWEAPQAVLK